MIKSILNFNSKTDIESKINRDLKKLTVKDFDFILGLFKEISDITFENQRGLQELKQKLITTEDKTSISCPDTGSNYNTIRFCRTFVLEAINTSIPIQRISEALINLLIKNQQNPAKYEKNVKILLYGISGGGKSIYVEWFSRKLSLPLHYIRFSDVVNSKVGETEVNIRNAFAEAQKNDAILFIDECDSLIMDRRGCSETWEISQVNEFLIQMERYPGILFCATNYADKLDSATDRRFHFKVEFFPCKRNQIELLLNSYFPQYVFSKRQVSEIENTGAVVPGDFGTLSGRLRFAVEEEITSDFIVSELCDIVKSKKDNQKSHTIGFSA